MRELALIENIREFARSQFRNRAIVQGIGDDCAIVRPRAGEDLVFTTDFVLEGRHFTLDTHSAADVGHKALARGLSDLAAMGSEPVFCLVSLALPATLSKTWLRGFYKGLLTLANAYRISLAGGDLASFDKVIADVNCCGRVPRGKAMLRSGAKPGDTLYVTGALGGAARARYRTRPQPRIAEGIALRRAGATAAIDVSDGLLLDLHRLCLASRVSACLDCVPVARGAAREDALQGGEDYELLFTASPTKQMPVRAIRIGTIVSGTPGEVSLYGKLVRPKGFDHFDESSR